MPNWTHNILEAPAEVLRKYISKDEDGSYSETTIMRYEDEEDE